ncbi:MAG TPA: ABC-2 family transporter protein [Kouleothrix sp.]|uniref:ABC transporter permease n=1 Tax=Kouleothrix sp. TaxID=2779161 RepID=UPI002CEC06F9|nr:ABC-2 family transporter protein [Kouleothrix sp.]HRC75725.1 ABC-2 family transporter protein [Kouleothrix sp.]
MIQATRKYSWIALTAARSNLAYLSEVATRALFLAVILYIFLRLWQVTYGETGAERLGGLSLPQMLWYLAMTEALTLSAPRVAAEVDQDVRTGALAVQLIRPLDYPLARLWTTLGERVVRFGLNTGVGAALALLMVGPIAFSPGGLLLFALALPLAFTLEFMGQFLIGLAAFWLEDTSGLMLIYSRITMILGGMLIPLELFPPAAQPALRALPFSSIIYGPARMFVHPDAAFLADLLLRQGLAIVLLALAVALVYRAGLRRIHSNGG